MAATRLRIRLAEPGDAPSIAKVLMDSFVEYKPLYTEQGFTATTPASEQIKDRMNEGPLWVALDGTTIIGTVSAVPKGESLYIRGMGITPAARGQRIGELLLRQVENFASERGFKRLFLSTTPFLHCAMQLYENYGFIQTSEGPHDLFGTPLLTMDKFLVS